MTDKYQQAFEQGHAARLKGDQLNHNPYREHAHAELAGVMYHSNPNWFRGWRDGWNAAERGEMLQAAA